MQAEEIADHYQKYHRMGVDIPLCLNGLSRVVTWRDRQVGAFPGGAHYFRRSAVKSLAYCGLAIALALSVAEFVFRAGVFFCTIPCKCCKAGSVVSMRVQQGAITNLNTTLFIIATLRLNYSANKIGEKMTDPRLSHYYLDFYESH